jgi:uncharacterized C2H2 Zn-finger protein
MDKNLIESNNITSISSSGSRICVICIEHLEDDEDMKILLCGHKYHIECFNGLQVHSRYGIEFIECPLCRTISHYPQNAFVKFLVKIHDSEFILCNNFQKILQVIVIVIGMLCIIAFTLQFFMNI